MIPVTKPYLPNRENLNKYIEGIYERAWLTNNGPLVKELTHRLEQYLGVENLLLVANGTSALQIAYRALGVSASHTQRELREVVTTPFSFIATASSLSWDSVCPVFADIDAETWCLSPTSVELAVNSNTRAIVPTHVFGNACDVEGMDAIAKRHDIKIIYDASHAFGVNYRGKSLLTFGDAATLSFHATKLFHTIEGGAIVFKRRGDFEKAKSLINFGISEDGDFSAVGINSKMNEFQAAMGLCVLDELEDNLASRERIWTRYEEKLSSALTRQKLRPQIEYNYAYYPVIFESEDALLRTTKELESKDIYARRYFFPSLDTVCHFPGSKVSIVSRDIASRILCLPIYYDLKPEEQSKVLSILNNSLSLA